MMFKRTCDICKKILTVDTPEDVSGYNLKNDIWVCSRECLIEYNQKRRIISERSKPMRMIHSFCGNEMDITFATQDEHGREYGGVCWTIEAHCPHCNIDEEIEG